MIINLDLFILDMLYYLMNKNQSSASRTSPSRVPFQFENCKSKDNAMHIIVGTHFV